MNWIYNDIAPRDAQFKARAIERQTQLTKPPGSLGVLEELAIRLADCQQTDTPSVDKIHIAVFAADHGVAAEGVSAFPQEVTSQMVANFLQGGAAISVLAKQCGAMLDVVDVGIGNPLPETTQYRNLIQARAGSGTQNSTTHAAMTAEQLSMALNAGQTQIQKAQASGTQLFIGGEMGIANTTSAAALYCALLQLPPEKIVGAGTGLDEQGIAHKSTVVKRILATHQQCADDPVAWLRCAGGFEIAALTGAYIQAAQSSLAVLVDGFISSVAALCAVRINPAVNDFLFFSHCSAEKGHKIVLESLQQTPLLNLGMRLGEGSGAAVALPLLQSACALHNKMATFAEAAVATQID